MNRRTTSAIRHFAVAALLALAWGLSLLPAAHAQATGGNLVGRVQDKSGAALPGATVTATQKDTGLTRNTVSEADGQYRLPSLPAGTYTVQVELNGFATATTENVTINVAAQREINFDLNASTVSETINVVAEAPLVQTTPAVGAVIDQKQIENLPLNGRQFANLAVLAPGTSLNYNSDPTKPGQLTIALNGGIGRNVNSIIDGGDNTDDTIGGALQNFNLESVQEFNIQTQGYKAEYGRSSGGVLTVVTKTGTNQLSGAAWGFFRKDSLNSETESEKIADSGKQPYDRKQYGASLGGPIIQDKLHYFATYEKTDRTTSYQVNAPALPSNGESISLPFKDELLTAKISDNLSPKQFLQVRYGYQKNTDKYGASSLSDPTSLGTVTNKYSSLLIGHSVQIGADSLNEITLQYTKFNNLITADSTAPYLYLPSGAHSGQNINTPQSTNQTKYQYKDDFSFTRTIAGRTNNFKTGFNYVHEPVLGGDSTTGTTGQYSLSQEDLNSPVTNIMIFGGFSGQSTPVNEYSGYVQDDILASDRLTINVGLRYDYNSGLDLDQRSNPIWQALSTQTKYNESYLPAVQERRRRRAAERQEQLGSPPGLHLRHQGRRQAAAARQLGQVLRLPLHQRHRPLSRHGRAVQLRRDLQQQRSDRHQEPGRHLLPSRRAAASQPAPRPLLVRAQRGRLAQPGDPLLPAVLTRLFLAGHRLAGAQPRRGRHRLPRHPLPLPSQRHRSDDRAGPLPAVQQLPSLGRQRQGGLRRRQLQLPRPGDRQARDPRLLHLLEGHGQRARRRRRVPPHRHRLRAVPAVGPRPVGRSAQPALQRLHRPAQHRRPAPPDAERRLPGPVGAQPLDGIFRYHSATPLTIYSINDPNGDGVHYDLLPGGSVNSARDARFSQLDFRLSKTFNIGNVGLELIAEVFNVFNETNPSSYTLTFNAAGQPTGNKPTAYAGDPLQGEQRLAQLGVRIRF